MAERGKTLSQTVASIGISSRTDVSLDCAKHTNGCGDLEKASTAHGPRIGLTTAKCLSARCARFPIIASSSQHDDNCFQGQSFVIGLFGAGYGSNLNPDS